MLALLPPHLQTRSEAELVAGAGDMQHSLWTLAFIHSATVSLDNFSFPLTHAAATALKPGKVMAAVFFTSSVARLLIYHLPASPGRFCARLPLVQRWRGAKKHSNDKRRVNFNSPTNYPVGNL